MHYNVSDAGVWADAVKEQKVVIHNDYISLLHRKGMPEGHAEVVREMVIPIIRDQSIKGILGVGNKPADYIEKDASITAYFADIAWDLIERRRNMEYLEKFNMELENRVAERTSALEKANRELDSFSYSISHDLQAPLRHIIGFADMLRIEVGDIHNEKALHFMDVIEQSAKRMTCLIDDLLSFSRLGRAELSVKNVNMEILLDEVMLDFTDEINQGKVSITRHPLPDVAGDRSMLRAVLVNLISNALKFSSKELKPVVEIGCEKGEGGYIFYIRDNGAGFDMHYAERLFGVFQRLHNEKDFPGTGIGLAIVRSIIERHNGTIRAESEPGRGACFYFTIPVHEQQSDKPGGENGRQQ
jgi:light-regulated signal transduction histidine kinase (bacteriophytochrome)